MQAIGAWVTASYKDDYRGQGEFVAYVSFGEYDEAENADTFGIHDDNIFFYADGVGSLVALGDWANGEDFVVKSYELEYSY